MPDTAANKLPGIQILDLTRPQLRLLCPFDLRIEKADDAGADFILGVEELVEADLRLVTSKLQPVGGLDQIDCKPEILGRRANAAGHEIARAQGAAN